MVISRLQAWTSSMLKPKVSLPKTSATFSPRLAACSNSGTKSRGVCSGAVISRRRLVRAQAMGGVGKGFVQRSGNGGIFFPKRLPRRKRG